MKPPKFQVAITNGLEVMSTCVKPKRSFLKMTFGAIDFELIFANLEKVRLLTNLLFDILAKQMLISRGI